MKRKFNEWLSIQLVKNPGNMVLTCILLFNLLFVLLSAAIISAMSLQGTEHMSFIEAAFITVTMILDAGCIQFVIEDIGQSGVAITLICLGIIIVGMISFTGAVIGYVTNYISHFIENSNTGKRSLHISDHIVILNWNTRASEIINDLLYCETKQKVVVLVSSRKEEIEKEIDERLSDTVIRENKAIIDRYSKLPFFKRVRRIYKERFKKNITVVVREGDVFSSKQLRDISLERAQSIIILGNDINNTVCKYESKERKDAFGRGNSQTVKTLMQVADITSAEYSNDDQKIIVEITDDWTWELVSKIINYKQVDGKCHIVPVRVNKVLGQILSQFSLMPELNHVYRELFSNKGAAFYSVNMAAEDEEEFIAKYLSEHKHALPMTFITNKSKKSGEDITHCYFTAAHEKDISKKSRIEPTEYKVELNHNYWIERKNIVILGHNSKCKDIMLGFEAFSSEWNNGDEQIVNLIVIDDKENLKKMNYEQYPFVTKTVEADIYDKDKICNTIEEFVDSNIEDTSILILSDDNALNEDIDANALANLIYVQDIINRKKKNDPNFDVESIDVIVEIIDPKHHDIVNSYSVNNVVISNRYISKMITQIGEKDSLYDFYTDILTYDTDSDSENYDSKEIYAKKVSRFFTETPKPTTADKLVRAVFAASTEKGDTIDTTIVLGYVKPGGKIVLFSGDQSQIKVELDKRDKLILFSSH